MASTTNTLASTLTSLAQENPVTVHAARCLELSVVMPCLNEAATIGKCVAKARLAMDDAFVDGEVIVSDNGSTDGSAAIAEAAGARIVYAARKGYGSALATGIGAARGTFVIMGDADDSYDFSHIPRFLECLREGDDLVMGNRFLGGIQPGAMPALHRYLGNPLLSGLGRLLFGSPCRDFHCGLRGFRREAICALGLRTIRPAAYVDNGRDEPRATWLILILPMMEQASLYQTFNANVPTTDVANQVLRSTSVPSYLCPSDGVAMVPFQPVLGAQFARGNYGANFGSGSWGVKYWQNDVYRGVMGQNSGLSFSEMVDGTTQTVCAAELRIQPSASDNRGVCRQRYRGSVSIAD